MIEKVVKFFTEVALEGKRITWPKRQELVESALVVIVFIVILAVTIMVCDELIRAVLNFILGRA